MMEYGQLDQYLLIKYLNKVVNYHHDYEKDNNPYTDLILINSENPKVALNRIINCNPDVYKLFSNLTTIQKAALIPKIEIFYRSDKTWKPINFRNFPDFNEFSNFATDVNTKFGFEKDEKIKEDGVGIKQITITDKNQNPGTVNLECTIELFFDNILALTNSSILKLIQTPDTRGAVSEKEFRLKLVTGWSAPTDYRQETFSPTDLEIIEKSNSVYLLSLVKHDLTFNQNGSINLTILYQGAVEKYLASSSDMDIFGNATPEQVYSFLIEAGEDESGHLATYIKETHNKFYYESLIDTLAKSKLTPYEQLNTEITNVIGIDDKVKEEKNNAHKAIDEKIGEAQEKLDEALKKISEIEMFVIKHKYQRFLTSLLNRNRLFFIEMDAFEYVKLSKDLQTNNKEVWDEQLEKIGEKLNISNYNEEVKAGNGAAELAFSIEHERIGEIFTALEGDLYFAAAYGAADEAEREKIRQEARRKAELSVDLSEISAEKFNEIYNVLQGEYVSQKTGVHRAAQAAIPTGKRRDPSDFNKKKFLTYTTLGDIINIARSFIHLPEEENIEILIGPCNIGNVSINIATFPIATSTFMIWFVNTVIRQSIRKYQFWEFIYNLVNSLISPFLRIEGLIQKETVNVNLTKSVIISDQKLDKGKSYLDTNLYNHLSRNIFDTKNVYSYLALYIYDYELDKRDGIFADDIKDGIYHYSLARDRGIIKSIDFSKIDFPRLRDLRLTTEGFNNVGDILREHYDMNLKTIGSPLFVMGGQVYFDGAYLGESGKNITELLGLGGYYLITKMETTVAKDLYETTIGCTWTSMRKTAAEAYKMIKIGKEEPGK